MLLFKILDWIHEAFQWNFTVKFLLAQERIALWHEQNNRYNSDIKKFRQQAADLVEKLGKDHEKLRQDLEGAGVRVDRVEREMDYIETKNPPKPCVKLADKTVEQKAVEKQQQKTKDQLFKLSGEGLLRGKFRSFSFGFSIFSLLILSIFSHWFTGVGNSICLKCLCKMLNWCYVKWCEISTDTLTTCEKHGWVLHC